MGDEITFREPCIYVANIPTVWPAMQVELCEDWPRGWWRGFLGGGSAKLTLRDNMFTLQTGVVLPKLRGKEAECLVGIDSEVEAGVLFSKKALVRLIIYRLFIDPDSTCLEGELLPRVVLGTEIEYTGLKLEDLDPKGRFSMWML